MLWRDVATGEAPSFAASQATIAFTSSKTPPISGHVVIDGGDQITLDGGGSTLLFVVVFSTLELRGLTLQNAFHATSFGGAIHNSTDGQLFISDSTFTGNSSKFSGGAIMNSGGYTTVTGSQFINNTAPGGGGAINSSGSLEILTSSFTDNRAEWGGAIEASGALSASASTFRGNSATDAGGAIHRFNSVNPLTIEGSRFSGNSCGSGGAIDKGGNCAGTDQRGLPRPSGSGCDIGSVEVQTASLLILCAHFYTGRVLSPANNQCGAGQFELIVPQLYPVTFCIARFTGIVHYFFNQACGDVYITHIVPDHGNLLTCVSFYSGVNRALFGGGQCAGHERLNVIPAEG